MHKGFFGRLIVCGLFVGLGFPALAAKLFIVQIRDRDRLVAEQLIARGAEPGLGLLVEKLGAVEDKLPLPRRIEFDPAWFDPASDKTPEGVKPNLSRYA